MEVLVATSTGADGLRDDVTSLVGDGTGLWAVCDGRHLWRRDTGGWSLVTSWGGPAIRCLGPSADGLLAGTAEAHLLRLSEGELRQIPSFETADGRDEWHTPWGAPPDIRSVAARDGVAFVNVHVGGLLMGDAQGPWQPLVDIDVDVHQVVVAPDGSILVASGVAGFGRSTDRGRTWSWDHAGLHGSYCRAIAVAGDQVLISASTGPHGTKGAVYRRPIGGTGDWERVSELVEGNVDTHWLSALGDNAAFASEKGDLRTSPDAGGTWDLVATGYGHPRAVVVS